MNESLFLFWNFDTMVKGCYIRYVVGLPTVPIDNHPSTQTQCNDIRQTDQQTNLKNVIQKLSVEITSTLQAFHNKGNLKNQFLINMKIVTFNSFSY